MKIDQNMTVLVTGANGGLGAAIARAFHARGAKVVLSARRKDAIEPLANELSARVVIADQNVPADVERLHQEARGVDVAVINAAVPASGELFALEEAAIESMIRINLTSPILTARTLGKAMAERGAGHLVLVSSVSGMVASPGASLYAATKFGLRGFALSLRAELHAKGVGVTTIFPGFIRDAGMFANSGASLPPGVGTRSPEDVANAVVRAVLRNPAEITVAAFDQKAAAFAAAVAPGVVDFIASRSSAAKRLSAEVAAGQAKHFAERDRRS